MNKLLITLCASSLVLSSYAGPSSSEDKLAFARQQGMYFSLLRSHYNLHYSNYGLHGSSKNNCLTSVEKNQKVLERELRVLPKINFELLYSYIGGVPAVGDLESLYQFEKDQLQRDLDHYQLEDPEKEKVTQYVTKLSEALQQISPYKEKEKHYLHPVINIKNLFVGLATNPFDTESALGEGTLEDIKDDPEIVQDAKASYKEQKELGQKNQ